MAFLEVTFSFIRLNPKNTQLKQFLGTLSLRMLHIQATDIIYTCTWSKEEILVIFCKPFKVV